MNQEVSSKSAILFVVENNEKGLSDKRILIDDLWEKHGIRTFCLTMQQVADGALKFDSETNVISYWDFEISVVYFRAGYSPEHYSGDEPEGWIILESSAAIKCPSIDLQIVTVKKIEEQMGREEVW